MEILVVMLAGRVTFKEGEATGWYARDDGILEIRKGGDVVGTFKDWAYVRTVSTPINLTGSIARDEIKQTLTKHKVN